MDIEKDALFSEAVELIRNTGKASASFYICFLNNET
jgi:hypothetical protein